MTVHSILQSLPRYYFKGLSPEDCERKRAKSRAIISCCVFNICQGKEDQSRPSWLGQALLQFVGQQANRINDHPCYVKSLVWTISNQNDRCVLFCFQKCIFFVLGTIPIICQHFFGLFVTHLPMHYVSTEHEYSTERQQKLPISKPTPPVLLLS